ncbi:hypothetical protein CRE_19591 [Caenorhabditis remanei]|uniref:Domain of unknown function DB domain-containing protein n=1 Tax=Caenorhabditis remanei TaxID=31234 RepID=E3NRN1_CAERE|nr:hypothetical protein CRE_19591 [Caenorhabditis remanei]
MDATVSSTGPTTSLVSLITMFSEVVVIGSIIALLTTGIHLLLTILKCSRQLFYCVRFMLSLFESLFRCICSSSCLKKTMNKPRIMILSMFLLLPCRTLSCNDVAHIAAQERACYDHINVTRCHVNSVSLVNLTLDVAPGIKYSIVDSNISITAVGIHTPPLQAHSATFISAYGLGAKIARWTSFTFTPTSSPGAPAKEFAGELQCKDKQSAEDFNCVFDPTLCKCVGFATKVNCRCFHEKMTEYRKNHKLPTRGINHQVLMINNRVTTLTVQETMVCCDYSIGSTKDLSVESSAVVIVPRTTVAPGVTNKVSVIPFRPLHFTAPPKNGPPGVSPPPAPGGQCGVAPDFTPCVSNEIASKSLLECCKRKNLPAGCQQLCRYDITQAEIRAAMDRGQCGIFNVAPFLECASQGKDNSECCRHRGIVQKTGPQCEQFCRPTQGLSALGVQHIVCGNAVGDMLHCHHSGVRI